jgi:transglutaminase-like putative cysteine protease
LALGGNPNLNHDIVFTVDSSDSTVYYETLSYDTYDAHRSSWGNGPTETLAWHANDTYTSDAIIMAHAVTQKFTIVSPLSEQYPYILGAPDIGAYNANASVMRSKMDGSVVAWLNKGGNLGAGTRYNITSYVSSADVQTLRSVPMPADAPAPPPSEYEGQPDPNVYNKAIVDAYTQLPGGLDSRILAKAKQIVKDAHATTMYDKVVSLESYFRDNYSYSTNIQLPPGEEGTSWFLFGNTDHKGFCNYFSTSMVVLARSLGIPTRVVAGYTSGEYDAKTHQRVIRGTDAHSWVQVYFAGYGWVNFEPSASFATFSRPLPNQYSKGSTSVGGAGSIGAGGNTPSGGRGRTGRSAADDSFSATTSTASTQSQVHQQIFMTVSGVVLLLLFALVIFMIWWRRLFRRYSLSEQLYGRICLLANWAGIQLKPSQTPYEYLHGVAASAPQDALIIERLGDIYVRDKWADPESSEHPSRSGEINELSSLWQRIQPHLFLYVLRHPHFLRWLPRRVGKSIAAIRRKRRIRKMLNEGL